MRKRKPSSAAPTSGASAGGPSKVEVKRGPWTAEEDEMLSSFIRREGEGKWRTLPKRAGLLRCGKSCRLRWMNYLRPSIKHGNIAPDEEDLILRLHRLLGNRWSLIAGRIPGRTDNEIKNYWNTHLNKKLISQGIDPRTHKPLNPNPNHKLKEPAPVTAPVPYPNPNPRPNAHTDAAYKLLSSHPEEIDGRSRGIILHNHQSNYSGGIEEAWQNFEGFELMGSEEDGGVDCCTDDVYSSFLDSLINEDMFLQPQQKQQQHQNSSGNNIGQNEPIDPTMPSDAGFGLGYSWEAGLPSATLGEDVHGQFVGQPSKHF